jgi:GxxExxY protein
MDIEQLIYEVRGAAMEVYNYFGPGLLESVYEVCLVEELEQRGIDVKRQANLPLYYKGHLTNKHFTIDLLVADEVIVELKSVDRMIPVYEKQLMTYLKLTQKNLGLLINFNVPRLIDGLTRRLNG